MNRQSAAVPILAALCLALAGCNGVFAGFTPLYATNGVGPQLSRIETRPPSGRTGQFLRESLDDALAKDRSQPPLYGLELKVKELRIPRGLRIDNVADRYEMHLQTAYSLIDLKTRKVLTSGVSAVILTYDSADQPYAGVAANLDAEERAADQASQQIRLYLGSYFAKPATDAAVAEPAPPPRLSAEDVMAATLGAQRIESPDERAGEQPGDDLAGPDHRLGSQSRN